MAIFDLSNAAGHGFDMSSTNSEGWAFAVADPSVTPQLVYDDGSIALFDVYGSSFANKFAVSYSYYGDGQVTIDGIAYGWDDTVLLSVDNMNLHTTLSDLQGNAWIVRINAEDDQFYGNDYNDFIRSGYGNDYVVGYAGNDILLGDQGRDQLWGGLGSDWLEGGADADRLCGQDGGDRLDGGSGNDALVGGPGKDTLIGGAGYDSFDFTARPSSASADRIVDFNPAFDTVRLDNAVMPGLGSSTGTLAPGKFWIGAHAHDANDRVVYDSAHGKLLYDGNGSAAGGEVVVATLSPGLHMTYRDIVVI
jgi:Ca2+-binding RTX toxin-like protein